MWDGWKEFCGEGTTRTLDGRTIQVRLGWGVVPGSEEDYARVLVSMLDVTDAVAAGEATRRSAQVLAAVEYAAERFLREPSLDRAVPAVVASQGQAAAASGRTCSRSTRMSGAGPS